MAPKKEKKAHNPRNTVLPGGVPRFSRTSIYRKRLLYKKKKVTVPKKAAAAANPQVTKQVKGASNGNTRVVPAHHESRYYPTEDVPRPLVHRRVAHPGKLRSSITPGTVLILLAGAHRGRRVVFLKQLPSGLLLVTGPYYLNGVPLRRVNQAYVIATSTKVDLSKVNVDAKFNDAYFTKPAAKKSKAENITEGQQDSKKPVDKARVADQQSVDNQLKAVISGVENLKQYLSSHFSLHSGQFPHELKF